MFLCMCVHMLMIVQMHVHISMHVSGSLELISDIFLIYIPSYMLKQDLLLDPGHSFGWSSSGFVCPVIWRLHLFC